MGKKQFISKQNSTKYDLIFRSSEASLLSQPILKWNLVPDVEKLSHRLHGEFKTPYSGSDNGDTV